MLQSINKITSLEFSDIKGSGQNTMLLLSLYSKLYLYGAAPKTCEAQMFKYYIQLKKDGIMKAELIEEIKNRTCIPKWNGHKVIQGGQIVSSETITDSQAIELLEKKILRESDFNELPAKVKTIEKIEPAKVKKAKK